MEEINTITLNIITVIDFLRYLYIIIEWVYKYIKKYNRDK